MGALDQQLMTKTESAYGTAVVVDRTWEFNSESISDDFRRTEGDPLRVGTYVKRADRNTPYYGGASGTIQMDVLTKGFGWWLTHLLGQVATTGPTETTVYTHTGTMTDLYGKSFTCQVARPLHPSGTVQPFTFEGGKVTEWTVSNSVEDNLVLEVNADFQQVATGTALATAAYPAAMQNLTWAGGTITVGGAQIDVTEFSMSVNNGLNTDRRFISGTTDKKEPTGGRREVSFSLNADFAALTERNRAAAITSAGTHAAIVATWVGPTLLGTTIYPTFQVNIPSARFDEWSAANEGPEGITQELSGVGTYDGSSSAVSVVYRSADAVA
jgi:hypothetical protein